MHIDGPSAQWNFRAPQTTGRQATVIATALVLLALGSAIAGAITDPRLPTSNQWKITAVLAAVAALGLVTTRSFGPERDGSGPPWDVHTIWLLPAAMLTPSAAFGCLVALSVITDLRKSEHQFQLRMVVVSITVTTTVAIHAAALLIADFALAGLVGIAALWLIGCIVAFAVAYVFVTPNGTALWLDYRWSLVLFDCAVSGLLIAAAMRSDPLIGFTGLAPLLLAQFALRWPELTRFARIDSKTGLPNSHHWDERSRRLLSAAEFHRTPAYVLMVDLDRFKSVNDTFGHLAGDQVLAEVATLLRSRIAPGDLLGRFGGEEFVVTLFDRSPADALAVADRIRTAIAAQPHVLAHITTDATREPGTALCTVSCSIGLASAEHCGYDLTKLLECADKALADAKTAGRDQVRAAGPTAEGASRLRGNDDLRPLKPAQPRGCLPLAGE